jgi:uncharacterized protein YndB with AHSA1/START domain
MHRDVKLEMTYPHPPEKVWRAIADPEILGRWLMPNDLKPVAGHEFQFRTKPQPGWNGIVDCRVTEADPPHRLAYTWQGSWGESLVVFTLTPVPGGTRLRLEHRNFGGMRGIFLSFILGAGWKKKLQQVLPDLIAGL